MFAATAAGSCTAAPSRRASSLCSMQGHGTVAGALFLDPSGAEHCLCLAAAVRSRNTPSFHPGIKPPRQSVAIYVAWSVVRSCVVDAGLMCGMPWHCALLPGPPAAV